MKNTNIIMDNSKLSKLNSIVNKNNKIFTGTIKRVLDGVAGVSHFNAKLGEIVTFSPSKIRGVVLSIEKKLTFVAILGNEKEIKQGTYVIRTQRLLNIPFSPKLLGHVLDGLGKQIDSDIVTLDNALRLRIECKAPGIYPRTSVNEPVHTGIILVDSMVPVGRGQRELIIGDRQTGKTAIALSTIINQQYEANEMFSIYVAVGQKRSTVAQIAKTLKRKNALHKTIIVAATASESPVLQYLAPYTGCTIGERFRDAGYHSLLIYDDLSKQAVAYRQMSLLLRKPPGREAFPGDVFYLHSRLLERAAKLSSTFGAGSLTALPIIETQASDVSAYIPTNVISITDGQIFLEANLFVSGIKPAVNPTLSVSRVGSSAQLAPVKNVSRSLKNDLAKYNNIAYFLNFGANLDEASKKILKRGVRLVEILKQGNLRVLSPDLQVVLIFAALEGLLDNIPTEDILKYKEYILLNIGHLQSLLKFSVTDFNYVLNKDLLTLLLKIININYLNFINN